VSKLFKKIVRAYAAGEVIFEQGADVDGIYSVQAGRVSVYRTKSTPQGPVHIEIVQLGPGSMFGEMGMLDQTKRDASVKAIEFTEVLIITKDMFETQMMHLPPWVVNFIKILISRLRATNDKLAEALRQLEAGGRKFDDRAPGDRAANPLPQKPKAADAKPADAAPPEKPAAAP
jgi:CRP-like cAMP-binding protein